MAESIIRSLKTAPTEFLLGSGATIVSVGIMGERDWESHANKYFARPDVKKEIAAGKNVVAPGLGAGEIGVDLGIATGIGLAVAVGVAVIKHLRNKPPRTVSPAQP